jgi:hypothetical protein
MAYWIGSTRKETYILKLLKFIYCYNLLVFSHTNFSYIWTIKMSVSIKELQILYIYIKFDKSTFGILLFLCLFKAQRFQLLFIFSFIYRFYFVTGVSYCNVFYSVLQEGFKMGLTLEGTVFCLDPLDSRCWCQEQESLTHLNLFLYIYIIHYYLKTGIIHVQIYFWKS